MRIVLVAVLGVFLSAASLWGHDSRGHEALTTALRDLASLLVDEMYNRDKALEDQIKALEAERAALFEALLAYERACERAEWERDCLNMCEAPVYDLSPECDSAVLLEEELAACEVAYRGRIVADCTAACLQERERQ